MISKIIYIITSFVLSCLLFLTGSLAYASDITETYSGPRQPITSERFMITSQFAPGGRLYQGQVRPHEGIDVGLGAGTVFHAPVDGYAMYGTGAGFGHWVTFMPGHAVDPERGENDTADNHGAVFMFGDLGAPTAQYYAEENVYYPVKMGDIIGVLDSELQGNSDGVHLHFEYWTHGYKQPGSLADPVPMLTWLGMIVENYQPGADTVTDAGSFKLSFNGLANTIGNQFSRIIQFFVDASNAAFENIATIAVSFLTIMCVLDLTLPIILAGMVIQPFVVVRKLLKYAAFMGFVTVYPKFVNDIVLNFVTGVSGVASGNAALINANVCAPQLLLQKIAYLLSPGLNKISNFGMVDFIQNAGYIFGILFMSAFVLIVFILFALLVLLTIIEFYVSAGLCVTTVPFGVFGLTKFMSEGAFGHLISSALRYMFLCLFVFMSVTMIQDANTPNLFAGGEVTGGYNMSSSTGRKMSLEDIKQKYPKAETVIAAAQKYGMDPYIVLAIFGQESSFGENTDSHGGGSGYMQIDPDQDVGFVPQGVDVSGLPGPRYNIRDLFKNLDTDPQQNSEAGVVMLFDKIQTMNGDIIAGIKAYNGGGDPNYLHNVNEKYVELTGMPMIYGTHMTVTAEQFSSFLMVCLALIMIAWVGYFATKHIVQILRGPIVIP